MRFPPEFIDRLRHHLPLSEVIGRRVPIRRHGREFQALCPFHKEKSPSFTVNDEKGFYHCFGCAAHGDAIGFIMQFEGVSYPDAVERLAGEAGLPLPKMTREAAEQEKKRHTLEDAVALAARWFTGQLETPAGREARDYVRDRGLSAETIMRFGIGFAPNSRDALKNALMKQGIGEEMLVEAGLLSVPDEGAPYDRFRGRLIFPIKNAQGKIVAFGGRILASAQTERTAKYLNSPETPLFKKGELLYAYDVAARAAREAGTIIVAEGYMDVIALHQAGFTHAVAPLGTAITESQLKLLWRASTEPVLCLDGDEAGQRAMWRAADLALPLLKSGFGLKFAVLPKGDDPDSLIRKSGPAAFAQALGQARVLSRVMWDQAISSQSIDTAEQKAAAEQQLLRAADKIADPTLRQHMRDYFRNQMFERTRGRKKHKKQQVVNEPLAPLPEVDDDISHLRRLEDQLMAIVLLHPDILHQAEIEEHFGQMELTQPTLDKLRAITLEVSAAAPSLDSQTLNAALMRSGHSEKVEILLQNTAALSTKFRTHIRDDSRLAAQAFEQAYGYTMKKLEREKHDAERLLASDMSEKNYERFRALQSQLEELQSTRYHIAPDEQVS